MREPLEFSIRTEVDMPGITNPTPAMRRAFKGGLFQAGAAVMGEVVSRTPVDTGLLKRSIRLRVEDGAAEPYAAIETGVVYAQPVETGTAPGRRPPPSAALVPWVRRHPAPSSRLTATGKRSYAKPITDAQRAYLIARALGRRGSTGAHMFRLGLDAARPVVGRIFAVMGRILARELGGSA